MNLKSIVQSKRTANFVSGVWPTSPALRFPSCNKYLAGDRCSTAVVCVTLQKIEVDPVKFAAELESYEDLKRRLVVDAALFGAVGAFAAFQVRLLFLFGVWEGVSIVLIEFQEGSLGLK